MQDYTGQTYNRVTLLSFSHKRGKHSYWNCRCSCGNEFTARVDCVISGNTKSCGCLNHEAKVTKHGQARTPLYRVYYSMKQRCYNPNDKHYSDYGGRGISICDEWLSDFPAFSKWAYENGYAHGLSIDRIDVNGNYEPSNCRWVTQKVQTRNTRRNTYITISGETKVLKDWCTTFGVNCATACNRIKRGYPIYKVFGISEQSVSTNCTPSIGTTVEAVD